MATLTLLVSEIVTNAVIHPEVDPPGMIEFQAQSGEAVIRVEVSDQGSGFLPKPRDRDRPKGGFGLFLLDKQAVRWGVESVPRTTVWFEVPAGDR
jgi:anti-sigma regulatory factor (Ser/Thr protein kinase)